MSDPPQLDDYRPHDAGWCVCLRCLALHVGVWPVTNPPVLGECPECHEMACIPHPEVTP